MPTYLYQEILEDGSEGEVFEHVQSMKDPPLERHPVSGRPVHRVYVAPNVATRYTAGATAAKLDNRRVERAGFTKYERDKLTGQYHKVAGSDPKAPSTIQRPMP